MKHDLDEMAEFATAFQAPAGPPPAPESCPPPDTLLAAVRGELTPEALRQIFNHTIACPACAEDWRLAAAFEREAGGGADRRPAAPKRWFSASPLYRIAAAAAVLVLAVLPLALHRHGTEYRGAEPVRSQIAPEARLPRSDCQLQWSPIEGATYDLRVLTSDDRIVVERTALSRHDYTISPQDLAGVPSGARLSWQVTAHPPKGPPITSSKSNDFVFILE